MSRTVPTELWNSCTVQQVYKSEMALSPPPVQGAQSNHNNRNWVPLFLTMQHTAVWMFRSQLRVRLLSLETSALAGYSIAVEKHKTGPKLKQNMYFCYFLILAGFLDCRHMWNKAVKWKHAVKFLTFVTWHQSHSSVQKLTSSLAPSSICLRSASLRSASLSSDHDRCKPHFRQPLTRPTILHY